MYRCRLALSWMQDMGEQRDTRSATLTTSPVVQAEPASAPPMPAKHTERHLWFVVAALTVLYVIVVAIGNRRYVWFDELFTLDIARSTSLHELWYRVQHFDSNPPTVYLLSRISTSVFGPTPFGLRFP